MRYLTLHAWLILALALPSWAVAATLPPEAAIELDLRWLSPPQVSPQTGAATAEMHQKFTRLSSRFVPEGASFTWPIRYAIPVRQYPIVVLRYSARNLFAAPGERSTLLQMNPPVRETHHRDGVWRGIRDGIVDVLGSDHAPHTLEEKAKPYPASPSGMTGVQTLVPVMLNHVIEGRLTLERFVDLASHGPQRLFGLARKGRIAAGYDADFTIVDMKRRETITNQWVKSRAGWTPYDGVTVTGWPVGTFVRGLKVMWEGELTTPSQGEPARFLEALPRSA